MRTIILLVGLILRSAILEAGKVGPAPLDSDLIVGIGFLFVICLFWDIYDSEKKTK